MPLQAVIDCSHAGDCDQDVEEWVDHIDLSHVSSEDMADELREYGAWDENELSDEYENKKRLVWIAACNLLHAPLFTQPESEDTHNARILINHHARQRCYDKA